MVVSTQSNVIEITELSSQERLDMALWLYEKRSLSLGKAASLAELSRMEFMEVLYKNKVEVYTEQDLLQDLETIKDF